MIVNHLCTSLGGGASVAAQRLHQSLRSRGIDSRFWYSAKESRVPTIDQARPVVWPPASSRWQSMQDWLHGLRRRLVWQLQKSRHLHRRPGGFELFTPARIPATTRWGRHLSGDVLHLHWVAKLFDQPTFFSSLPPSMPVVWTLHDMNPFTGGCHFSSGCERFARACGHCPQIAGSGEDDLSRLQLLIKQAAMKRIKLHVVAPSRWLLGEARRSAIFSNAVSFDLIPYGIRTDDFHPVDQVAARQSFSIPEKARVIGFGADALQNRRKGWDELVSALKRLVPRYDITALIFGGGNLSDDDIPGVKIVRAGFVAGVKQLANLYSAMDFFVLPSLEDNLPQTGLEAMACGTPVVAFDAGGISDFVLHGQTGLLAKTGDCSELATRMQQLLDDRELLLSMSKSARRLIQEEFDSAIEASRYENLYRQCLPEGATSMRDAA